MAIVGTGQLTAVTSSITQVTGSSLPTVELYVQADPANTANVQVGSVSPKLVLIPGQIIIIPVTDASFINVLSASGSQTVNWLARN